MPPKTDKIFFENLDGWRFFCFLSVFLFHSFHTNFSYISNSPVYHVVKHHLFGNGNLGVNFFFVLSGFLITYLLLEEKEQKNRINIPYFWIRRILRIWPLYFFCVFFGFVLFPLLKQALGQPSSETANPLFFLTFTSNFDLFVNGLPDSSVLGVLWSVAIEEQFYLVWPLVIAFVPNNKLPLVFAAIVGISWLFRALYDLPMYHEYHTLSCIGDMAIGACGAYFAKTKQGRTCLENLHPGYLWVIYTLFFGVFFFRDDLLLSNFAIRVTERSFTALLIIIIITEQCFCRRSLFKMKRLKFAGNLGLMTYGLYCLHFIGILSALTITQKLHFNTQLWQVLLLVSPSEVSLGDSLAIAGGLGKLKAIDFSLRPEARYTVWSGLFGGLFVALAYFGTDQSQVGRYLSGSSLRESRLGLLFNGLVKIPMQLGILFLGLMLFVFYQFHPAPIFFNTAALARAKQQATTPKLGQIEAEYDAVRGRTEQQVHALVLARQQGDRAAETSTLRSLRALDTQTQALRAAAKQEIKSLVPRTETKDADYVFIGYITRHFPKGLVGLLIAVILCAAMSATASALNALGSTTVVDFYRRSLRPKASDAHYLAMGKVATAFWGILATLFAAFASLLDNLIQAVNILGSLFYGPTLGVFLVGFFLPRIGGTAIFSALVIAQIAVLGTFFASSISFLWYNVIGCGLAVSIAYLLTLCGVGNVRPDPQPTR